MWKLHAICPLFKRGSAFLPGNYRGVHLTPIFSKIAEKVTCGHLIQYLQQCKFGKHQWAFTPGLGSRDLVTALMMSWILSICKGKKVGGYLGDISGAFDRVNKAYLLAKLSEAGVGPTYLNFLDAYLEPRVGQVLVEGTASDPFEIANSVFQGTVLGPTLWNVFFADIVDASCVAGGETSTFADDLSVFQEFDRQQPTVEVFDTINVCRQSVHDWGRKNRVLFDAGKEHLVVVHPLHAQGEAFKLLGLMVDCKLVMNQAIEKLLATIRPKIAAIVRTRAHYDTAALIIQFKTHIWGLMEANSGGIFHASTTWLNKIDGTHRRFLRDLDMLESTAFLQHNFAPPTLKRNIAILGALHKRVLGKSHPIMETLLPFWHERFGTSPEGKHSKQLYGSFLEVQAQYELYKRSIFAMCCVYNNLPQDVVDAASVSAFQSLLTQMARARCEQGAANWVYTFDLRQRT